MHNSLDDCIEILRNLVAFPSVSATSTREIVTYISEQLNSSGVDVQLSFDATGERANILATIGPGKDNGIVLNGHTDVVPAEGQPWTYNPFMLTEHEDKFFGRGSVDMKGFLACVLASVPYFQSLTLKKPIHMAFSYDEEIGGLGMPGLLNQLTALSISPSIIIVGEPTSMKLITAHKGGFEMRTEIKGVEVHSCDPRKGVNAISIAAQLIQKIESIARNMADNPKHQSGFEPPYCSFNIGTIHGGIARNATAGYCAFDWEFRPMPGDNGEAIVHEIELFAQEHLLPMMKRVSEDTYIKIITEVPVPALDDANSDTAAQFVSQITGLNSRDVVSFGTDAGYFSAAGMSTVVIGPGNIDRAHKADEYITRDELNQGLTFLRNVADALAR